MSDGLLYPSPNGKPLSVEEAQKIRDKWEKLRIIAVKKRMLGHTCLPGYCGTDTSSNISGIPYMEVKEKQVTFRCPHCGNILTLSESQRFIYGMI